MRRIIPVFIVLLLAACSRERPLDAQEILRRSIEFHDPEGHWGNLEVKMQFKETSGSTNKSRKTMAWINQPADYFKLNRGGTDIFGVDKDSCFIEKGKADCARAIMMKDYYTYLWGLPMKLMDEGTQLMDSIGETIRDGRELYILYVHYEKDDWQYFIDKNDFQLHGYQFVQTSGNKEDIVLGGLYEYEEMRIPAIRSWYQLSNDNKFLGRDELIGVEPL